MLDLYTTNKQTMAREALDRYRESVPTVIKKCKNCDKEFETKFGTFCSTPCKGAFYKETKRLEKCKDYVCYFCGGPVTEKKKVKFCCDEHAVSFESYKRSGRKISIKINDKTTIFTNKYDKIPEVVAKMRDVLNDVKRGM